MAVWPLTKPLDQQKLMIAILNNGNDPVFAKEAATEYIASQGLVKASPRAILATSSPTISIDVGFPTTVGNVKTYQFTGYITGVGATLVSIPIPFCSFNIYQPSGSPQGTMSFSAGSRLVYTGTFASASSFTGSAEFQSDLTYDNFGIIYPDYATIIKMIQSPSIGAICSAANSLAKYIIIKSGTVTANMVGNYSASNTATSFTSAADFKVTLNSPAGIVIQPGRWHRRNQCNTRKRRVRLQFEI